MSTPIQSPTSWISNLYRLGALDMVIQRALRHAKVSTTGYYIKTAARDVRDAMTKF